MRYAWYNTLKAKYFSATTKSDSMMKYNLKAMRIYWRNRGNNSSDIPTWQFYSNYVSCSRNGGVLSHDNSIERIETYSDTCIRLLDSWWPKENMEKLRIEQALLIIYYDRSGSSVLMKNDYQSTAIRFFKKFERETKRILKSAVSMAGVHHPIYAQSNYLLGMNYFYSKQYKEALSAMDKSIYSNFSSNIYNAPFCLNINRYLATNRYRLLIEEKDIDNKDNIYYRKKQLNQYFQAERAYCFRYLYWAYLRYQPEDDVYSIAPYREIKRLCIELNRLTGNEKYLELAWNYSQKNKYTDLARHRFRQANLGLSSSLLYLANIQIDQMRCMNDTLMLYENQFSEFKNTNRNTIRSAIQTKYNQLFSSLRKLPIDDPIIGNQLNRKSVFSISEIQKKMSEKNAAWIDISHLEFNDTLSRFTWFILPDTFWCEHDSVSLSTNPQLQLTDSLSYADWNWKIKAQQYYISTFQTADKIISKRGIQRLVISQDPNYEILPFEYLFRGNNFQKPDYLINHYAVSYQLAAEPDFKIKFNSPPSCMLLAAPKLNDTLIDLTYARKKAHDLSYQFQSDVLTEKISSQSFLKSLPNYSIVQVYSHGAGKQGIYFSDGLLKAADIRKLQLNTELISLTTCESSKGKMYRNEGTLGMVEAFTYAGAKRQLATLWRIDERSSVLIMETFYAELKKGIAVDEALRRAKLHYLETAHPQEKSPVFWAGIILYGNPDAFPLPVEKAWQEYLVWFLFIVFLIIFLIGIRRLMLRKLTC
jgi:CHAT domain-containing protein